MTFIRRKGPSGVSADARAEGDTVNQAEEWQEVWPEVWVDASRRAVEPLEDWLLEAGALSVTLCDQLSDRGPDQGEQPILEPAPGQTPLWDAIRVVGLFAQGMTPEQLQNRLLLAAATRALAPPTWRIHALADSPWARAWMDDFQPMAFGPRLWVCPSHCTPPDADSITLKFDPGLAFGTGTHPTTALCLAWLGEGTTRTLAPLAGQHVIDYGCGSGILGVAAACLGANRVLAVDIDPQALAATRDNARRNGVDDRVTVAKPEGLDDEPAVPLLLANILFQPLIDLAESLVRRVQPGGTLVLSGILHEQAPVLMNHYRPLGIVFDTPRTQDGWALLVARRSAP